MTKKLKCSFCQKKIGLISFPCKCNGIFCQIHRYTHSHNCTYIEKKKEDNKKNIQKQNPKTEATTLEKIN